ncbi:hypothetical protein KIH27_21730, partial [Mycobacterium sp. M1]|nr:hypothetical protein [Mycolicibacter acidiphilus]
MVGRSGSAHTDRRGRRRALGAASAIGAFLTFTMTPPAQADPGFDDLFDPAGWAALLSGSAGSDDVGAQLADSFQTDFWLPF